MSDIQVDPGTVALRGTVGILNVGEGDTKLSFDPENPADRIRAARIVTDMLRRGYALLVEESPGSKKFVRAHAFDEARCEYIIADLDPGAAEAAAPPGPVDAPAQYGAEVEEAGAAPAPAPVAKKKAGKRRVPADKARAVAVGRTAGG